MKVENNSEWFYLSGSIFWKENIYIDQNNPTYQLFLMIIWLILLFILH